MPPACCPTGRNQTYTLGIETCQRHVPTSRPDIDSILNVTVDTLISSLRTSSRSTPPTYQQLGRLYLDNGRTRDALTMAQQALDNAVRYNQTDSRIQSLRLLSDIYAALGEWQLANSNSKEALILVTNQKNQMDADISTASLKAQTLIRWCEDNVVITSSGFTITEEREHRLAVYAWLIAEAIVIASLIFLYSAVVRKKAAARLVDTATQEKVNELQKANDSLAMTTMEQAREQCRHGKGDTLSEAVSLQFQSVYGEATRNGHESHGQGRVGQCRRQKHRRLHQQQHAAPLLHRFRPGGLR